MKKATNGVQPSVRLMRLRRFTNCGLMAALLCILSPWVIPLGGIPFSLSLVVVLLAGVLLGGGGGASAVAIYLLVGAIGLPVFGGGSGGFSVLIGPTGGYLWSYPLAAFLSGLLSRPILQSRASRWRLLLLCAAQLPSVLICYLLGTLQFWLISELSLGAALGACVLPFLPFDLVKCLAVSVLGGALHERMKKL